MPTPLPPRDLLAARGLAVAGPAVRVEPCEDNDFHLVTPMARHSLGVLNFVLYPVRTRELLVRIALGWLLATRNSMGLART
ncbi:hypothetical protein VK792_12505 [Mesobacterium sp. TK19101]|uniref:LysR substrate-binding domain-containing protein n=1 Tax=Mesobacterium hydrothermale TaxID=3111907 RepID=A0ABU6HJ15_9RHOB|nr:hypothetical protein [Mesobacterium sp. TK19101]MEC3862107.1 hypothetical protein [Mesobacterium sp. TK19101]